MKKFDEFIKVIEQNSNESFVNKYWKPLEALEKIIRKDCTNNKIFNENAYPRFDFIDMDKSSRTEQDPIWLHVEIKVPDGVDVPEYFDRIKKFFEKYHYIKMINAGSTLYYDIYLDFEKISQTDMFKSLMVVDKFKL